MLNIVHVLYMHIKMLKLRKFCKRAVQLVVSGRRKFTFVLCLLIFQEKLDFAMNDIIFDLLSVGRTTRAISPEV